MTTSLGTRRSFFLHPSQPDFSTLHIYNLTVHENNSTARGELIAGKRTLQSAFDGLVGVTPQPAFELRIPERSDALSQSSGHR